MEFENKNLPAMKDKQDLVDIEQSRAITEVQAQYLIAQKNKRDEDIAAVKIKRACNKLGFASKALYSYPRGGKVVSGPSIRLAECITQARGNCDYGIVELSRQDGRSIMLAYHTDLETNTTRRQRFIVEHERKADGVIKKLDDPRDVYEMTANMGARRLRSCIIANTPFDIIQEAIDDCRRTMASDIKSVSLQDRIKKMVVAFDKFGVTKKDIEGNLGHPIETTSDDEFVDLHEIYRSLEDGEGLASDFFKIKFNANQTAQTKESEADALKPIKVRFEKLFTEFKSLGGSESDLGMTQKDVAETADAKGIMAVNEAMTDWIAAKRKEKREEKKATKEDPKPDGKSTQFLPTEHPIRKKVDVYCAKEFKPEQIKKYVRQLLTKDVGALTEKQFDQLISSGECGNVEELKTYIAGLKNLV
jgi:hypothetical protein